MRTRGGQRGRRGLAALAGAVLAVLLVGCTNTPPPPLVSKSATPSSSVPATPKRQLTVGVSSVSGGYNPHSIADQSTITTALSKLLLPSVFRPGANGELELDETLMRSAEVTGSEPFTVTYRLRGDASWSDSAPIVAEDFVYLWQQMRNSPGVINPSGYQLITNISSRDGGKIVEVNFAKPYPGWRTLFANLLPAHLLKDAPGGWSSALDSSFPAFGGPFSIKTLDVARGEILLERNERYWERPAALDQVVLRRSDQEGITDALRNDNNQVALARTDATGRRALDKLAGETGIELRDVPQPTIAGLLLRPIGPRLSDPRVRDAVAAMLNRDALIATGADGGPGARLRADSLVSAPSSPGYRRTMPADAAAATHNTARGDRLLREAGYRRQDGGWVDSEGDRLRLVVAAPRGNEPYLSIAEELRRQLTDAGIEVELDTPPARQLYGDLLAEPNRRSDQGAEDREAGANIVVGPQPAGGDPATMLAQRFGCRALPGSGQETGTDGSQSTEPENDTGGVSLPANPAAFCDPELQPAINDVLTGARPLAEVLPGLEPRLWRQSVVVPLFQLADTLAVRPEVSGVEPGPGMAGPFLGATEWRRSGR